MSYIHGWWIQGGWEKVIVVWDIGFLRLVEAEMG